MSTSKGIVRLSCRNKFRCFCLRVLSWVTNTMVSEPFVPCTCYEATHNNAHYTTIYISFVLHMCKASTEAMRATLKGRHNWSDDGERLKDSGRMHIVSRPSSPMTQQARQPIPIVCICHNKLLDDVKRHYIESRLRPYGIQSLAATNPWAPRKIVHVFYPEQCGNGSDIAITF